MMQLATGRLPAPPAIAHAAQRAANVLLRPSWTMLAVAALITAVYLAVMSFVTYPMVQRVLAAYPGEDSLRGYFYGFSRVTRYLNASGDSIPTIVIVGASTARESIWSEAYLEERIEKHLGTRVGVVDLTFGGAELMESYAAAEIAFRHGADYVVFATSLGRMDKLSPRSRFGYHADGAARVVRAAGLTEESLRSPEQRRRDFIASILGLLPLAVLTEFTGDAERELKRREGRHRFVKQRPRSDKGYAREFRKVEKAHVPAPAAKFDRFFSVMLKELDSFDGQLILFDTPLNPALRDGSWPNYSAGYEDYRRVVGRAAHAFNVPVLSPNDGVTYKKQDFADFGHLRSADAIKRTSDFLALELARLIQDGREP